MPPRRSCKARTPLASSDQSEQAEIADQEILLDAVQYGLFGRCADLAPREIFRPPFLAVAVDDASSALIEAEHGQRRNQHRCREQKRRRALVERLHPQPEIKPDAAVDPGHQQDREHQPHLVRPHDPVREKHLRIELLVPEQGLAEPHAGNMGDDQRGNAEAEHELQRLDRLPAKLPALVKRPDAETGMDQRGGVEHDRDREKLPEQHVAVDAVGQRLHRDIAERMVEEMADQIGEQHQPADEADLPDADAAEEFRELGCGRRPCGPMLNGAVDDMSSGERRVYTLCRSLPDSPWASYGPIRRDDAEACRRHVDTPIGVGEKAP